MFRSLSTFPRLKLFRVALVRRGFSSGDNSFDGEAAGEDIAETPDDKFQQQIYRELIESLTNRWQISDAEHKVFVIQPNYKYKMRTNFLTNVHCQLEESVALVESLPRWHVVDKALCSVKYQRSLFFGRGQLETLVKEVHQHSSKGNVTAVFVSANMLTTNQLTRLKRAFGCDVYDRYALVLEIFRRHAKTSEAKLQVALAEVPYVRARITEIFRSRSLNKIGGGLAAVRGPGETLAEQLKSFLHQRESHIMKQLKRVEGQRSMLRSSRERREIPSIAVVGYTNAGKTSLIRYLSGDVNRLKPNPRLFATLDVTSHGARLPCGLRVIFLDTVGFLSDLPTQLVAAFKSTLEDVKSADLIVHVIDLSNPDWPNQKQQVMSTLASLQVSEKLMGSMIEVGNKSDLPEASSEYAAKSAICISAKTGQGMGALVAAMEPTVLANTGRRLVRMRIPTAGRHLSWLYREHALVATREASSDGESLVVDALFTDTLLARFRAQFGRPGGGRDGGPDNDDVRPGDER